MVAVVALSSCLGACAIPDLSPPSGMSPPESLASERSLQGAGAAREWPRDRWWTAYGDAALDALVDEAMAGSPSVAVAHARIRQARGAAEAAGGALLPSLGGQASGGITKQSYNNGIPPDAVPRGWNGTGTLALSADYDLDLWGANRKALAAATSEAQAAEADAYQAELMLASNVVSSYFDLARLIEQGRALQEASDARAQMVALVRRRVEQGLENEAPLRRAEAAAASARARLSANAEQVLLRRHALAALLGAGPDRGLTIAPGELARVAAPQVPVDAGIALAGRRPDIIAARLRVEAASARVDVAHAAFLPNISLRGLVGLTSLGLSNLIDGGSTYGNAGAALSLPLFQGGRLSGNLGQARGAFAQAVGEYNATVVGALREVADGVSSLAAASVQDRDAAEAARTAAAAHGLAMQRYRGGLTGYLDALTAQTAAIEAREAAIDAHFRTLALDAALKRALGGGFVQNSSEKASDNE